MLSQLQVAPQGAKKRAGGGKGGGGGGAAIDVGGGSISMLAFGCVAGGVLVGVVAAIACHSSNRTPWLKSIGGGRRGISLQTLSYGIMPDLDLAALYVRGDGGRLGDGASLALADSPELSILSPAGTRARRRRASSTTSASRTRRARRST